MQMMSSRLARPRINTDLRCWKYPLPTPLAIGIGVLAMQSTRQQHPSKTALQIALVEDSHSFKMSGQGFVHTSRQYSHTVCTPFPFAYHDLVGMKVNVLYP